ncbi:DUF4345 domain-containing protein [Roseococcus sp. SYP-B2431]|nr:DUF4345 domain-containing protein [Roseococcus sp. SYP-B2431]
MMLRATIWLACSVPILAGLAGCVTGGAFLGAAGPPAADSHIRYLSGLLLGIGVAFAWAAFDLERRAWVFEILAPIVALGGLARLLGLALAGPPPLPHLLALGMELVVTPALWLWVRRSVPSAG